VAAQGREDSGPEGGAGRAVPLLALGLLALALAQGREAGSLPRCLAPREASARAGHSVTVRCGEGPASRAELGTEVRGPARILFGQRLDLGTIDAATLEVLPGVGPSLAAAILRARDENGVRDPADLARVPGIGARRAARLTPWFDTGDRE
jgi:competence protein ComEA